MTIVWLTDIYIEGSRAILFDRITEEIYLDTEVDEEGNVVRGKLLQDNDEDYENVMVRTI